MDSIVLDSGSIFYIVLQRDWHNGIEKLKLKVYLANNPVVSLRKTKPQILVWWMKTGINV